MARGSGRLGWFLAGAALSLSLAAHAESTARGESLLFTELPVIEAASLRLQSLEEAPAAVTVVTAKEIRTYGYRTLGEALAFVRGFYLSDDGIYQYLGTRGFSLPGDYATRILVMLNGHYLTDNIYSSNGFFGQDFPVDLDLVERIEIIRGPSSALYGSNGMFATINVVTLSPVDHPLLRASAELGSYGEKKLQLSTASHLGRGLNLLLSTSAFATGGRQVDFPGGYGPARGVGRERGQHAFATLLWRNWSFTAMHGNRLVHAPHGVWSTVFNDPGNMNEDGRSFLEAVYSRDLGAERQLEWRLSYDRYRYWGRWDLDSGGDGVIFDNQDLALGDWVGSRITFSSPLLARGRITAGSECNVDLRKWQWNGDVFPDRIEYANVSRPDRSAGAFGQLEWILSRRWTAYAGLRVDYSHQYGAFASPRLALIYQRSAATTWKFLFGRAFRNPNAFEAFYEAPLAVIPNPALAPETIRMAEVVFERKLAGRISAGAGVFTYRLRGLIQGLADADGLVQFRNTGESSSSGGEIEVGGRPWNWLNVNGNFSVAKLGRTETGWASVNSPSRIASMRFAVPLLGDKVRLGGAFRYWSARRTIAANRLDPVTLVDFTAGTAELHPNYELQFGVRNLFDRIYFDPVGPEHVADRLPQRGRTVFVKLTWRSRE
jgi:outer membrane receptor for ferrienterochelin and colicins